MVDLKTFRIDVKVVGFTEVICKATTLEEAMEIASDQATQINVKDLRWKSTQCTNMTDGYQL